MAKSKIDPRLDFLSPISLVRGLGAVRTAAIRESGIETIGDLVYYFPRKYIDRSKIIPIAALPDHVEKSCAVIGTITKTHIEKGRKARLRIQVADDTGSFEALWFQGVPLFCKILVKGKRLLLYGKVKKFIAIQMLHPMVEFLGTDKTGVETPFLPHYSITVSMKDAHIQQKTLFKAIQWVLKTIKHYPQTLPETIEKKKGFPPLATCLKEIHTPSDPAGVQQYYNRLKYEELYRLALSLRWSKRKFALPGRRMQPGSLAQRLMSHLPFTLSDEQQKAIAILYADAASDKRMHRLLQGDVGSGKTIVAFFSCLPALNEGMQAAWLSPTEVLAQQSYDLISSWLNALGLKAALLTSGVSADAKAKILADLRTGRLPCIVGTHALLQSSVVFSKLGMIVIDEQHKFGVDQRLALQQKDLASDFLLMSATPIPQTLAKTLYGDLDIVTLRTSPKQRQEVSTHLVPEEKRADMERFIRKEVVENGSQAFYIVPRVETCDDGTALKDIASVYETLRNGPFAGLPMAAIHGKIDAGDKERIMKDFSGGAIKLLCATTVVEVGIDVPNATLMIIENADRFGLSQLHQLRGRVGRGSKKAYTFLLTGAIDNDTTQKRLSRFCTTHDGFAIADMDLTLRGPGEVGGLRQSGWDELKIADIMADADTFREIQEELDRLLLLK